MQEIPYVSPIIIHEREEIAQTKREGGIVSLIFGFLVFGVCLLVSIIILFLARDLWWFSPGGGPTGNNIYTATPGPFIIDDYSSTVFNTNYTKRNTPAGVDYQSRPQLDLLLSIVQLAEKKEWDGNLKSPPPFSYKDIDQATLYTYIKSYNTYVESRFIPNDKLALFVGNSETTIAQYLREGRTNFIDLARKLGINSNYLDEIESYVLPDLPERIVYLSEGYNNNIYKGSATRPLNEDYSRKVIEIDPHDLYLVYKDLSKTIFGQRLSQDDLIKASAQTILFHEMSHVLMQAYINIHVPLEVVRQGNSDMWKSANIDFLASSKEYYWAWQFNKEINDERIAQGMMLKCLKNYYSMSDEVYEDLFDIIIEKDNLNMNLIQSIGELLHGQYNVLLKNNWESFGEYLFDNVFINAAYKSTTKEENQIKEMLNFTLKLPYYIGYFNPAVDRDMIFLKEG